jgi:transposase
MTPYDILSQKLNPPVCPETLIVGKDGVMSSNTSRRYPQELRERAVRMVVESRPDHSSEWETMVSVASKLGVGSAETIRHWVRAAGNPKAIAAAEESAEVRRLKTENRELRRANEILKAAAGFFAAELDRPQRNW